MTCVWDGIRAELRIKLGFQTQSAADLVRHLQSHNIPTPDVLWNGEIIPDKLLMENYDRITNLDINTIQNGYDTSSCEPVLFLVAQLWQVNIQINFNGTPTLYEYVVAGEMCAHTTLNFRTSASHFSQG